MALSDVDRVAGRTPSAPPSNAGSKPAPVVQSSLTEEHIVDARLHSPDDGATLDLSRHNLTDVSADGAEYLATFGRGDSLEDESSIERIALSFNRLATLPTAFALLSQLRYLNLKNNSFSVFPDVLTVMPSLEILDISRNKIKRLPSRPGTLANIHVFCLSRNKITRLPSYLADFQNLDILKIDHNPLEWPPTSALNLVGPDDPQSMKDWIASVQRWIRDNGANVDERKPSLDSILEQQAILDDSIEDSIQSWSHMRDPDPDPGVTPHARTFSLESDASAVPDLPKPPVTPRYERPPPLRLQAVRSYVLPSGSASPESYLPTPEESVSSTDEEHTAVPDLPLHSRNASSVNGTRDRRPALFSKKTLPETNGIEHHDQRGQSISTSSRSFSIDAASEYSMPSPQSHRQDSGSDESGQQRPSRSVYTPPTDSPRSAERVAPQVDKARNAYFRRLSSLPAGAVTNNLAPSLRHLAECARSIYFSVSQVYQALSHYITYTIDQQLSSVLKKVTDPAHTYMTQLNSSLDRFDALAKKPTPPPQVCRGLVECCRDTVAVFGKAIGVLALQLKILASKDDDRYMRSLILTFYGATTEISCAWQSMAPHIDAIKPLLSDLRRPSVFRSHTLPLAGNVPSPDGPNSASLESPPPHGAPLARPRQPNSLGGAARSRRHAGSFSSKDVEIGRSLPAYDLPAMSSAFFSGMSGPMPMVRTGPRHPALTSASSASLASSRLAGGYNAVRIQASASTGNLISSAQSTNHMRQLSQASLTNSSASSSPMMPPNKPHALKIPESRTLVDKDALDAMEVAVESAPAVWGMMDRIVEDLRDMPGGSEEVQKAIARARETTGMLKAHIRAIRDGEAGADKRGFREDAHVFVKAVVKLSNIIKMHGSGHELFPALRAKVVELTNATQEFTMLLHVSSFTPATPRGYSPMTTQASASPATSVFPPSRLGRASPPIDIRLGANLSRSRSTQQARSKLMNAPMLHDVPRSALPHMSFNIAQPVAQVQEG